MNNYIDFKGVGIYKKIKNKHFDDLVKKIRLRFKAELVTAKGEAAYFVYPW
jgi:KDO2-lipid IV(A) lauroyltransferase